MILLDTNVISELMRPVPDRRVEQWLAEQPVASLFLSAVTEGKLRYGLALLDEGRRKTKLLAAAEVLLAEDFSDRVLPFDRSAALSFAQIAAARRRAGRPISQPDAQIAGTACSRGAALATRNVADFEACGVVIINPWTARA